MRMHLLFGTLALTPVPAAATPVYVDCEWFNGQYSVHHDYSLDEQRGTASRYVEEWDHSDANLPVVFTPNFVVIDEKNFHTRIDRRTLKYKFESYGPSKIQTFDGQCKVIQKPPRQF